MLKYEEYKKEFIKTLYELTGKYNAYDVFNDFIDAYAITLQNAVWYDQKREDEYKSIVAKYTPKQLEKFISLGSLLIEVLTDKYGDFLGEVYEELQLNDKKGKAQCFTPYTLGYALAKLSLTKENCEQMLKEDKYIKLYDGCVGGGCLLVSACDVLKELKINFQKKAFFLASDLDPRCVRMSYIQLSLIGAPGIILCGNTLTNEYWEEWHTPMYVMNYHIFGANPLGAEKIEEMKSKSVNVGEQLDLVEMCEKKNDTENKL